MRQHLLCILLLLLGSAPVFAAAPNVVLITIDTLRADRVGCYGYKPAQTPNLNRVAREGVYFRTMVAAAPLTLPSHCSIMTGTNPPFHGVRDNVGYTLGAGVPTLAEILRQRGYSTAAFVSSYVLDKSRRLDRGFDTYSSPPQTSNRAASAKVVNLSTLKRPAEDTVGAALAWLRRQNGKPFFLWIHLYDPHDPYEPPAKFRRMLRDPYDGEIAYVDYSLGALFAYLEAQRLYDPGLIVVTSDHGESFGEHGEFTHGYFIYDTTLLVPLIVKPPAGTPFTPRRIDQPARGIDLAPTILQFVKAPIPPSMEGTSLLSLIEGIAANALPMDAYSESYYPNQFGWSALRSLRQQRFKYIDAPHPELYDLLADPGELHNLLQNQQAIAHEIRGRLEKLVTRLESNPQQGSSPGATADLDILKSLGYVATSTPLRVTSQHDLPDPKDKLGEFKRISTAAQLTSQGRCVQALPSLEHLAHDDPSLFIARSLTGQCHFAAGDYASARNDYAEAARLRPYSVEAVFYVAACDLHLGHPDVALSGLNRALELQPDYPYARYYLGLVYQQQNKLRRAIEELEKCVTVDPDLEEAQAKLGFLLAQSEKYSEAATHFRKVVELDPENAEGHFNLALAYAKAGKTAAAQLEMEVACRLNPAMCRPQNPQ